VQTQSLSSEYGSGFAVDGTYFGGTSTINLKAFGVFSGGPYASEMAFFTSSQTSLTEKMRLDSSGNLGLGVTPSAWGTPSFQIGVTGLNNYGSQTNLYNNAVTDASNNPVYIASLAASAYRQIGGAHQWYTAPSGTAGDAISFTQAMTLDASGNLLVGTTSVNGVGWTLSPSGSGQIRSSATTSEDKIQFANGNGVVGAITTNGTATAYNTSSDARLKENISTADDSADLIDAIQVRQYDWKSDGSHQRYGMVAQELDQVFPEAVSKPTDPEEMMGVDYSKLVPLLLKEIQSLRARVAQLEAKGA
jgi:hypothetical protein